MSLLDLITSITHDIKATGNTQSVTLVTPESKGVLRLQPPSLLGETRVTPVTLERDNVREETDARNDDADMRLSWIVFIDGKPARVMTTRRRSYAEVLRSMQARWPGYEIDVIR